MAACSNQVMRHIWLEGHNTVISENIFTILTDTLIKHCHIQFNSLGGSHKSLHLFFWLSEIVEMKTKEGKQSFKNKTF